MVALRPRTAAASADIPSGATRRLQPVAGHCRIAQMGRPRPFIESRRYASWTMSALAAIMYAKTYLRISGLSQLDFFGIRN